MPGTHASCRVPEVLLHSARAASRPAALLLPQIRPVFSVVAPCRPGASRPSMLTRLRGRNTRPSRSAVGLCIAVIALSAFLPGISSLEYALFEPLWVLLPDDTPVAVCRHRHPVRRTAGSISVPPAFPRPSVISRRVTHVTRLLDCADCGLSDGSRAIQGLSRVIRAAIALRSPIPGRCAR